MSTLNNLELMTKNTYIYQLIKDQIIEGRLKAGERLIVADMAKLYNVSPMPIREALNRLQQDGFVESEPYKGVKVASFDLARFREIGLIRTELESLAAKLAVPNMTNSIIEQLEKSIEDQRKCVEKGDNLQFIKLNREFHLIVYRASKCEYLCDLILSLWSKSEFSKTIFIRFSSKAAESLQEHVDWLEALKQGDTERCAAIVRKHKEKSFDMLVKEIEATGDAFIGF